MMIVPQYCLIRCNYLKRSATPLLVVLFHQYYNNISYWSNNKHPQWNSYQKIHNLRSLSTSKKTEDNPTNSSSSTKDLSLDDKNDATTKEYHDLIQQFHRELTSSILNKKQSLAQRHEFENWWRKFEKLFKFYQIHGHCNVSSSSSSDVDLLKFVHSQRKAFKGQQTKKEYAHWKIKILKSIGFQFDPLEEAWNDKFNELVEYVQVHGNSLIPQIYPINPQLAKWTHEQRVQYRLLLSNNNNNNNKSFMTWERVDRLESIGFIWDVHDYQWEEHVEEFRQFVQQHGHGLVPQSYGKLGRWVNNVRQEYRKWIIHSKNNEKTKSQMNNQRFLTLQEEGFIWDVHDYKWQEKCAAVCAFRNLLGRWPTKKDDPTLAYWIKTQNDLYNKQQQQQSKTDNVILTSKRVQILKQIGLISISSKNTNKNPNTS